MNTKALCRSAFVWPTPPKTHSKHLTSVGGGLPSCHVVGLWFSRCAAFTSGTSSTWELGSNANSQALPPNQKLEVRTRSLSFSRPCRCFWCKLKLDNRDCRRIVGVWIENCFQWGHHFCPSILSGCFGLTLTVPGRYLICRPPCLCRCHGDMMPSQTLLSGGRVGRGM